MSTFQTAANVLVALKRETTTGVAATASGATQVRIIASAGLELKRANVVSAEKQANAVTPMGRLGYKSVDGTISSELTVGGATDIIAEAVMRSAWVTATTIGFASVTTVAIGTNTLTANAGDWVGDQGVRVGDIFTVSGTTVSGNNGTNNMVVAVTSLTITTVPAAFTTLTATATGTLTILKRVITAATPTRYTHTIEQYDRDIDLSELFLGCRATGLKLTAKPGAPVEMQYTFMGLDRTQLTTGTSPWFTSPTVTTGVDLIADNAAIVYNGAVIATFTGFDLDFSIAAKPEPVIGSLVAPDIFDNNVTVTGTISGTRSDFSNLVLFDAETEFGIGILMNEPSGAPPACFGVYLPRVKIGKLSAPVGGQDGAKIETLNLIVGAAVASTGTDATVAVISSSAP